MLRAAETTCKTDTGRQRRDNEDSAFARAKAADVAKRGYTALKFDPFGSAWRMMSTLPMHSKL